MNTPKCFAYLSVTPKTSNGLSHRRLSYRLNPSGQRSVSLPFPSQKASHPSKIFLSLWTAFGILLVFLCIFSGAIPQAVAARIKDLTTMQGVRTNQLVGYGIVVGLDGTGDQTTQTPFTTQSMTSMLAQLGVNLPAKGSVQLKNVAAVMVTANLPAFAKPGQTVDITVASLGNAKSLKGGTLLLTPLKGVDGQIYAMAQGQVLVSGAGGQSGGSSAQVNHLNAGRIPGGATVEQTVQTAVGQGEFIHLETLDTDFTTVSRVTASINQAFGSEIAQALDGRTVRVQAPVPANQRISFLARLENLVVDPAEASPKVIVNARTGSIVMNQKVSVLNCAVAHGNLTVTIGTENQVSQPNPLSAGQTVLAQQSQVEIKADKGGLSVVPASTSLTDVVGALNKLGATPQDLLAILQAMKSAGALQAELEII